MGDTMDSTTNTGLEKATSNMKASRKAILLIQAFEGCKLNPYICPAGILTVGFGHTGDDVILGAPLKSLAEAEALLLKDIEYFEKGINKLLRTVHVPQSQFDALTCFAFNLGLQKLAKSTLLKKVLKSDVRGAADEFLKWNKATVGGKLVPLKGLTNRRAAERKLFLKL
jgi:lysozyme